MRRDHTPKARGHQLGLSENFKRYTRLAPTVAIHLITSHGHGACSTGRHVVATMQVVDWATGKVTYTETRRFPIIRGAVSMMAVWRWLGY